MMKRENYTIIDRACMTAGNGLLNEAVFIATKSKNKSFKILNLQNGDIEKVERFTKEQKAKERWKEVAQSYQVKLA